MRKKVLVFGGGGLIALAIIGSLINGGSEGEAPRSAAPAPASVEKPETPEPEPEPEPIGVSALTPEPEPEPVVVEDPAPTAEPPPMPTPEESLRGFVFCERLRAETSTMWGQAPGLTYSGDPRVTGRVKEGDYVRILTPNPTADGEIRIKVFPHDGRAVGETDDQVWINWESLLLNRLDRLLFTCEDNVDTAAPPLGVVSEADPEAAPEWPEACAAETYDRDIWGDYPPVPAGAVATWTMPADAVSAPGLAHDHHVALQDAHLSGGCYWDDVTRDNFSSDLANLNPTTSSFNASKGSRTPDQLTGIAAGIIDTSKERCAYAQQHQQVKTVWELTMTEAERAVVEAWLGGCGTPTPAPPPLTPAPAPAPPPVQAEPTPQPAQITHDHCQRVRNDGGCDRRYRPAHCPTHSHATLAGHQNDHC